MRGITRKLKSNRGASILLVLGLLLICIMVSSVIIAAAASGSTRNKNRIDQQQAYLSISSAVQVVMDELQNVKKYVGREEVEYHKCNEYESNLDTVDYMGIIGTVSGYRIPTEAFPVDGAIDAMIVLGDGEKLHENTKSRVMHESSEISGALDDMVIKSIEEIYIDERNSSGEVIFDIALAEADERLHNVNCAYEMDKDYNITMKFTLDNSNYSMTLEMKAVKQVVPGDGEEKVTEPITCTHKVYYKKPLGSGNYTWDQIVDYSLTGTKEITTTTITWNDPQLKKGVTE